MLPELSLLNSSREGGVPQLRPSHRLDVDLELLAQVATGDVQLLSRIE